MINAGDCTRQHRGFVVRAVQWVVDEFGQFAVQWLQSAVGDSDGLNVLDDVNSESGIAF